MSIDDVILVATAREEIRGGVLQVDVADIPRHMAKVEAEARQAKLETEMKTTADTEAHAEESMAPKAKSEAEAEPKAETEASEDANLKAERDSLALAEVEAELRENPDVEAREKWGTDAKAKAEADAEVADVTKVKAKEEAAAEKEESEAKQKAEKERLEIEAKSKVEAAKAEEERKRIKLENAELCAKQAEEQIARQRAAEKAVIAGNFAPAVGSTTPLWGSSGSWFSQLTSVASAVLTEEKDPNRNPTSQYNSDPWSKRHPILEVPVKPTLRIDHIRDFGTSSAVCTSGPEEPADEAPLCSLESEDWDEVLKPQLSKTQKKSMRIRKASAQKQAQKGEKNSLHYPSRAAPNSVDNSLVQEPKTIATAPVDIPGGEGEVVRVS